MTRALVIAASVVLLAAGAARAGGGFDGPTIADPVRVPDFALHDQHGKTVRLSAERGNVVLLTFLYTHCPDLCPLTAAHIKVALDQLAARRKGVVALAVTVDPKGDTKAAIRAYVRAHRLPAAFHYLTGSQKTLERIWRLYNVTPVRKNGPDPDHTLYILLLDRTGMTRVLFDALAQPRPIAHDLGVLLG